MYPALLDFIKTIDRASEFSLQRTAIIKLLLKFSRSEGFVIEDLKTDTPALWKSCCGEFQPEFGNLSGWNRDSIS